MAFLYFSPTHFPPSSQGFLEETQSSLSSPPKPVKIISVWAENLLSEFHRIQHAVLTHPFISMDAEFPGLFYNPTESSGWSRPYWKDPEELYEVVKTNVDGLNLIQMGLTLSDADGNLPDFGSDFCYIWEFNFCDFDLSRDLHAPESIELLRRSGIDFEKNRVEGVCSSHFAQLLCYYRLVCNDAVTWVTFHGTYDLALLVKVLTLLELPELPEKLTGFLDLLRHFFGQNLYDVKHMIRYCDGLYGGLDRVAQTLDVKRMAGRSHQAGSDSLLTSQVFLKLHKNFFTEGAEQLGGIVHGFY